MSKEYNQYGKNATTYAPEREKIKHIRWDKKMSDHSAYALIIYTLLQIFMVMNVVQSDSISILPYIGLLGLVAFIIPFCISYERKWKRLYKVTTDNNELSSLFRRDRNRLWAIALLTPSLITLFLHIFFT